ncbi:hypothetical protein CYLTODRAFT_484711 [Cylindrobasidium torrendii FP15055 ss-10]|uniref:Uncharacterized protein n=1 Tax=Cylindrobasidium torrendii FP15055 ss-10 TaxID=1314674 RepID=A0A0D7BW36_9AGAR|nr:hypothetical protein CYLTODRAFT_484711 [Cylindrobasidium torrendii FP15055 ss-10]
MIRRPPTLLKMTDLDVEDVRQAARSHKAIQTSQQLVLSKLKPRADDPSFTVEDTNVVDFYYSAQKHLDRINRMNRDATQRPQTQQTQAYPLQAAPSQS